MEQKKLLSDLKNGNFAQAYLLYGSERYLVQHYAKEIEKAVLKDSESDFCKDVFDGAIPTHEIIMAAETLPFFAGRRLIIVKDSRLFATGRKDDSEKMAEYLPKVPESTVVVFVETDIDKRSKLFKQMAKVGAVLDCEPPAPNDLVKWVTRQAKEGGKVLPPPVAHHFVRTVGANMQALANEMAKLVAYCGDGEEITAADVNIICTPTLESRIFDLVKAMVSGRTGDALKLYNDMLTLKESSLMVLSMIIRQFRIVLLSKCAKERGMTIYDTAKELGLRDFMVQEALGQGRRFTVDGLLTALEDCMDTDVKVKTGLISPELGVEMLIMRYGQ